MVENRTVMTDWYRTPGKAGSSETTRTDKIVSLFKTFINTYTEIKCFELFYSVCFVIEIAYTFVSFLI